MDSSNKQLYIGILVFAVVVGAVLWGISSSDRDMPDSVDNENEAPVEDISLSEESIEDQEGDVLISADDVPGSIQVSENSEFGVSGSFTSAKLSGDKEWIAFATGGAAHDAGWLYEIRTEEVLPVAFQYGGGVEVIEWSPDSQYVAFMIGSPAPSEHILIVDRENIEGYVSEIGHQVMVEEQAGMNPPFSYTFERWESPHTLCFTFEDRDEECINVKSELTSSGTSALKKK